MERALNWKEQRLVNFLVDYVRDAWETNGEDISDDAFDDPRSLYEVSEFFEGQSFDEDDEDIDYDLVDAAALEGVEGLRGQMEDEEEEEEDEAA